MRIRLNTPAISRVFRIMALLALVVAALLPVMPSAASAQEAPPREREERGERRPADAEAPQVPDADRGDEGIAPDESAGARAPDGPYRSPYRLKFRFPESELLFDARSERGSVAAQSSMPEREWYSEQLKHRIGSWGPPARKFDCPAEVREKPPEWKRERVIAAASRFLGYDYQHHHIPGWNPPEEWPWKKVCSGRNGKGVDCSNFSAFNYNWALGIHLSGGIRVQAEQREVESSHGKVVAKVIDRPKGEPDQWYDELVRTLKPGDLLYIRTSDMSKVSHVIMWLGECAEGPDATPLVMDSHGAGVKDASGVAIPCGIHIRPFNKGSWYHKSFDHAHRLIAD